MRNPIIKFPLNRVAGYGIRRAENPHSVKHKEQQIGIQPIFLLCLAGKSCRPCGLSGKDPGMTGSCLLISQTVSFGRGPASRPAHSPNIPAPVSCQPDYSDYNWILFQMPVRYLDGTWLTGCTISRCPSSPFPHLSLWHANKTLCITIPYSSGRETRPLQLVTHCAQLQLVGEAFRLPRVVDNRPYIPSARVTPLKQMTKNRLLGSETATCILAEFTAMGGQR